MPALIGPEGFSLFESMIILDYLIDKLGSPKHDLTGQGWLTPEARAKMRLMCQVHDMYIASPNAAQPGFFGTQGCFYKGDMPVEERSKRVVEFSNQLANIEGMLDAEGPFMMGSRPCVADCVIFPTVRPAMPARRHVSMS